MAQTIRRTPVLQPIVAAPVRDFWATLGRIASKRVNFVVVNFVK
jgi:hypothetical protein